MFCWLCARDAKSSRPRNAKRHRSLLLTNKFARPLMTSSSCCVAGKTKTKRCVVRIDPSITISVHFLSTYSRLRDVRTGQMRLTPPPTSIIVCREGKASLTPTYQCSTRLFSLFPVAHNLAQPSAGPHSFQSNRKAKRRTTLLAVVTVRCRRRGNCPVCPGRLPRASIGPRV